MNQGKCHFFKFNQIAIYITILTNQNAHENFIGNYKMVFFFWAEAGAGGWECDYKKNFGIQKQ